VQLLTRALEESQSLADSLVAETAAAAQAIYQLAQQVGAAAGSTAAPPATEGCSLREGTALLEGALASLYASVGQKEEQLQRSASAAATEAAAAAERRLQQAARQQASELAAQRAAAEQQAQQALELSVSSNQSTAAREGEGGRPSSFSLGG
jgi:hypothetical protein